MTAIDISLGGKLITEGTIGFNYSVNVCDDHIGSIGQ